MLGKGVSRSMIITTFQDKGTSIKTLNSTQPPMNNVTSVAMEVTNRADPLDCLASTSNMFPIPGMKPQLPGSRLQGLTAASFYYRNTAMGKSASLQVYCLQEKTLTHIYLACMLGSVYGCVYLLCMLLDSIIDPVQYIQKIHKYTSAVISCVQCFHFSLVSLYGNWIYLLVSEYLNSVKRMQRV